MKSFEQEHACLPHLLNKLEYGQNDDDDEVDGALESQLFLHLLGEKMQAISLKVVSCSIVSCSVVFDGMDNGIIPLLESKKESILLPFTFETLHSRWHLTARRNRSESQRGDEVSM